VATVKQQPDLEMETAVESAASILRGEDVEPLVIIPLVLVTAETLEEPAPVSGTIGFAVSTLANPFFVTMKEAGEAKAAELGLEMITLDAQDNNERQASQIEDLISRGVDVLIINPVDSDAVATSVQLANEAGIPVITVTRPSHGGEVVQHLDIDNAYAGQLVADQLVQDLGGEGRVAILEGIPGAPSAQARQEGFLAVLEEYPDIEVVSSLTANYSREEGARVMEDVLQANPVLDAVYAHNDEMALGAVRAIEAAGRMSEIKVYGIDAIDDALQAIRDGQMVATVKQQPDLEMETAVESAASILRGEDVEPLVIIPLVLVTADNLE
jgi:ribose transport system substrate-binding protein